MFIEFKGRGDTYRACSPPSLSIYIYIFFQLLFDSIRACLQALLLREIKRAVFVSSKNRVDKFRRLVPARRRYSSRRHAGFSPANISCVSHFPDVYTRPFFRATGFQRWTSLTTRPTLLSLTGGRLSNSFDEKRNMSGFIEFLLFLLFLFNPRPRITVFLRSKFTPQLRLLRH